MDAEFFDQLLVTFVPIVVYWAYSGVYEVLGSFSDDYRLHSREDEEEKNSVSKGTVVKGVLLQQMVQTLVATVLFPIVVRPSNDVASSHQSGQQKVSITILSGQFLIAMLVQDTWQYFIHRMMHESAFLYRHVHSLHHRLIVPYAFGALYNHPVEVVFDTVGSALAFSASGMSARASVFFFAFITIKTIDDHCGLLLPGNPIQLFFKNNTSYHDVHHQPFGRKSNFSQSFFIVWDRIFGTYMPYSVTKRVGGGFENRPTREYCKEF